MTLFNRDLSWLGFNLRVLQEAADETVPLFERLRFLSIFSSNLNEFFRVRYPQALALSVLNKKIKKTIDRFDENIIEKLQVEIKKHLNLFGSILCKQVIPDLKKNGIIFYYDVPLREEHIAEVREIFFARVLSFIQPIYLGGKAKKKFIPENNRLYFVITLSEKGSDILKQAIVNIPSEKLNRFFSLQPIDGNEYVIFIDDIVRENLNHIFPGQDIKGVYSIKINRDSELHLEDEYSGNLLLKIESQLKKRDFGPPSRLLYQDSMPVNIQKFLASLFSISYDEMFTGGRYHNLNDLSTFPTFNKDLFYPEIKPLALPRIINSGDIFNVLLREDILLHLPYQSYSPVLSFFNQAVVDADVTEIYITLYRVASESHIINALISAAKNGKRVVAFIELKARFDEANNIKWSKVMKDAGVKIIYSLPDIKVHSKIALIRKKSDKGKQSFSILSTGNFNEVTAQFYTDHVLLTSNESIGDELLELFRYLEAPSKGDVSKISFHHILVSQFNMVDELEKLINNEIEKSEKGLPALIRIKVNNLEEPGIIKQLYKAAKMGVKIQLLVRGINCLVPELDGQSENIMVKRIVDRYLEHSRLLFFGTGDEVVVLMGSADLMTRNLKRRIEVYVKIKNEQCREELIHYFNLQWLDNVSSVWLKPAYAQEQVLNGGGVKVKAQEAIFDYLSIENK